MRKIKDFLNSKQTFNKVLNILNQYGDMSRVDGGFVAGGSVANTIYHLLSGHKLVINDIDVYRRTQIKIETNENIFQVQETTKDIWYSSTYINEDGLEIIDDHYGRTYVSETGSRMRIVEHSRKGIFNDINYIFEEGWKESGKLKTKEYVILEGFDLNCCKVGLDLNEGKIIYTPEFLEFLKTRQIKVVNPCAPIQTTIRIYNKLKDLEQTYCNIEHEIRFLTVALKRIHGGQITKILGPITKEKYDKIKSFVSKYFILKVPVKNELPYELRDKNIKDIWLCQAVLDFDIVEGVGSINNLKRVWELMYSFRKKSEQDKINKIFYKNVFLGNMKEDHWKRTVYMDNNNHQEEPCYYSNRFTFNMLLTKKNYHKCDFSIKHVDFVDKFINEHYALKTILKHSETLTEQYKILKFIKSLAKKEGDWVIGVLENINWSKYREGFEGKLTEKFIINIIKNEKDIKTAKLIDKVDLSDFKHKDCVKEFNTTIELLMEGKKMGHCVGGYSESIRSGNSRIFHIECDGIGSTLEVSCVQNKIRVYENNNSVSKTIKTIFNVEDKKFITFFEGHDEPLEINRKDATRYRIRYSTMQHSGRYPEKGNLEPTELNKEVAKELVRYLNEKHLPENYNIPFDTEFTSQILADITE